MSGFSKDSTAFLQALAKNNNRDWFTENKTRYETTIKHPAKAFSQDMAGALDKLTGLSHRPKIFRIYRDIRFSKDKTPYNTHQRISFIPETKRAGPPAWFLSLEKDHLILGTGVFGYEKTALEEWRERVAGKDGGRLAKLLETAERQGLRISEPDLKRVPSGYDKEHPRGELLRRKGLAVWLDFPDTTQAYGKGAIANCLIGYKKMRPIFDFLSE